MLGKPRRAHLTSELRLNVGVQAYEPRELQRGATPQALGESAQGRSLYDALDGNRAVSSGRPRRFLDFLYFPSSCALSPTAPFHGRR